MRILTEAEQKYIISHQMILTQFQRLCKELVFGVHRLMEIYSPDHQSTLEIKELEVAMLYKSIGYLDFSNSDLEEQCLYLLNHISVINGMIENIKKIKEDC